MAPTFEEWSADFWDELVLVGEALRHDTFTGELDAHRISIEPDVLDAGGTVRISCRAPGRDPRAFRFRLSDAPAKLAAAVGAVVVPHAPRSSDLLTAMHGRDFVRSVRRAERQATSANHLRDVLLRWAARLLPYLEADPELTVADALARYRAELRGGKAR